LGLGVVALTSTELQLAQDVRQARPALSPNDCFALSCATRADHTLVTADKALRSDA
jgi:predicted nucleic acid-binding protein